MTTVRPNSKTLTSISFRIIAYSPDVRFERGAAQGAVSLKWLYGYIRHAVEHSESLNLVDAITMEFWFVLKGNSVENNFPRPVSKGQSTVSNGAYGVWINDTSPNDIGFRCITLAPNDIRSQALPNYDDGDWHHVVVTYDGKSGKLYFDGENHVDIAVSGDISQTDEPFHIGDGNNERHFNGVIDEVRIYKKALDENEVLKNYNVESNSLALSTKSRLADFWGRIKVH